jgi:TM2 domain-containing membrane protein YozV
MNIEMKAALLSGFVFPGSGQMYLKRYGRGLALMVLVLAGIGGLVAMAVQAAFENIEKYQAAGGAPDLDAIARIAATPSAEGGILYPVLLVWIACLWIFSVIDAYRLGRAKPRL